MYLQNINNYLDVSTIVYNYTYGPLHCIKGDPQTLNKIKLSYR